MAEVTFKKINDYYLVEAVENVTDEVVIKMYSDLLSHWGGGGSISILQDFRELETVLNVEKFSAVMHMCNRAGVKQLKVATVTRNMGRAYSGVIFQEVGAKYDIALKVFYSSELSDARKWLMAIKSE